MKKGVICGIFCIGLSMTACAGDYDLPDGLYAVMKTNRGEIIVALEYRKTPLTVTSFVGLAEGKMETKVKDGPYFDGLKFHRVEPGFVIQGGDPKGDGTGGPGYQFPEEIVEGLSFGSEGIIGMANAGPGTNGSQFFITLGPAQFLDGSYTVFGHVVKGMDVVKAIKKGDTIQKVTIIRQGKDAQGFKADRSTFEKLKQRELSLMEQKKNEEKEKIIAEIDARWPGCTVTTEGIRFLVKKEGTGQKPAKGKTVTVHYTGMFLDGKVFDSSRDRNQPFEFPVGMGRVIPGWDISVADMKPGENRIIILPPEMAYGARGAGGVIPPNAWLVFDVELIGIK
jgi:peptidylprolyl isomerase